MKTKQEKTREKLKCTECGSNDTYVAKQRKKIVCRKCGSEKNLPFHLDF